MSTEYIEQLDDYISCMRDEQRTYSEVDPMFTYYSDCIYAVEALQKRIMNQPFKEIDDILYLFMAEVWTYIQTTKTDREQDMYGAMYETLDNIYTIICVGIN